jgi:hypothetical protein
VGGQAEERNVQRKIKHGVTASVALSAKEILCWQGVGLIEKNSGGAKVGGPSQTLKGRSENL